MFDSLRFFLPVILLIAAMPTSAQELGSEPISGWYAGAGAGYASLYSWWDTCDGCYAEADYGSGDLAFTLTAGYRLMRYFALEIAYLDSGSLGWTASGVRTADGVDTYSVDADIDLTSFNASVLAIWPFWKRWDIFLRGGVASWKGESRQTITRQSTGAVTHQTIHDDGTDILIGVGAGVTLKQHWHIRFDYAYFGIGDKLLALGESRDAYSDFATLQLIYRFGDGS
jgi:opacity protein-like surface antigen